MTADCYVQPEGAEDPTLWTLIDGVELTGTIQLYLPVSSDESALPQVVTARLKSDHQVTIDGERIIIISPAH